MNLEPKHNQAIREEIGERLQLVLPAGREDVPPRLRELLHRFGEKKLPLRNARRPEKQREVRGLKYARDWLIRRGARRG